VTIDVDGLLARTPLPDIIGSYTPIKKKGSEWVARCCFHTPDTIQASRLFQVEQVELQML
jgi:DNA primase